MNKIVVVYSLKFFIFSLFLQLISLQTLSNSIGGNVTDHLALLEFKATIVNDPQRVLSSWNHSVHFCNWEGITCGRKHRRVTILDLQSKGLVGSLSPYIGNASFLREIRLQNNSFHGEISPELGYLSRLQVLHLGNNSFEGKIPLDLCNCSNLQVLHLGYNKLTGNIPFHISTLSKLVNLAFGANSLNGAIPPSIGNLTLLETFGVAQNFLNGALPDTLGQLKHLSFLSLGANKFSGTIPPAIYNISTITSFSVIQNQFHGTIPSNIGILLPKLQFLSVWGNNFNGPVPVSLANATELEVIDFGGNFTGKIDVHFGQLQKLQFLSFAGSNLGTEEGDDLNFITSLQNCSHIRLLDIGRNRLKGVLPLKANFSSSFQSLSIGSNQIYGALPQWLFTLNSLTVLSIQFNEITGTIPMEIGNLERIQVLYLDSNRLSGSIPSSIGNLSSVTRLQLSGNDFDSVLPTALNWHNLLFLNLSASNFSGYLPKQLFSIPTMLVGLDISLNNFEGTFLPEIGNLFNLNQLFASKTNLTGKIPNEIGNCKSLEILLMNGNNLQDILPSSFVSLRGLRILDLSENNLSGQIPKYLQEFSLEYLNLSFNNFEGEVPKGVFSNASAIFLGGNSKLCGGIPKLKLPRCINQESKKSLPNVAKYVLIAISCALCLIIFLVFLYCKFRKKSNKETISDDGMPLKEFQSLSYDRILKATNEFSSENLLGVGSFGSVYKGNLEENGAFIAVKVLNLQQHGAAKSFMAECKILQNVRHRNLLRIITSCSTIDFQGNDFKALVYEYMPNGNLEKWLHPSLEILSKPLEQRSLNLLQRMNIAIDIGNALDYLHSGCHKPIIHCDLKPNNILLDDEMIAHIGDFGLAKFLPRQMNLIHSSSLGIRGTIGYTAPEYGLGSEPSTSGDVYSYGILLLEIVTGKKPTDEIFAEDLNLHNFARMSLPCNVLEKADPVLLQENESVEGLIGIVKVGVSCSVESPQERMDISTAVNELVRLRNNYMRTAGTKPLPSEYYFSV